MRNILFIGVLLALAGCNAEKRAQKDITKAELLDPSHVKFKDSTSTTVQYVTHDSVIHIPGQTIVDTFTQVKTVYHYIEHKGNVTLAVTDSAGRTTVKCNADSLQAQCQLKDKIIKQYQDKSGIDIKPQIVYQTHFYTPIANGALILDLVIILCALVYTALKIWAKVKGL